jgi:hypothetical protein
MVPILFIRPETTLLLLAASRRVRDFTHHPPSPHVQRFKSLPHPKIICRFKPRCVKSRTLRVVPMQTIGREITIRIGLRGYRDALMNTPNLRAFQRTHA